MTTIIYSTKSGVIPSCDRKDESKAGEYLIFKLNPQPSVSTWVEEIEMKILEVSPVTRSGVPARDYLLSYDDSLVGGLTLGLCNFDGLPVCRQCISNCEIEDVIDALLESGVLIKNDDETYSYNPTVNVSDIADFSNAVIGVLDSNGDGVFDANDIPGFSNAVIGVLDSNGDGVFDANDISGSVQSLIQNAINQGDITVPASSVVGFCAEVSACISNNTQTQATIISLIQAQINSGSIQIPLSSIPSHNHTSSQISDLSEGIGSILDSNGDGAFNADDISGFCAKIGSCIENDANLSEQIAEELESKIEIEDLSTTAPAGSNFVSDGSGGLIQSGQVYNVLPTINVGSPIVSDVTGEVLMYYWDGNNYSILGTYESKIDRVLLASDGFGDVDITSLGVIIPQWANSVILQIEVRAGNFTNTFTTPDKGTDVVINGSEFANIDVSGSGDHNNAYIETTTDISTISSSIQYSINKQTSGSSAFIYIAGFKRIYS